jgi:uncharacterized Fe-S radical SAM superfamily protein PflX
MREETERVGATHQQKCPPDDTRTGGVWRTFVLGTRQLMNAQRPEAAAASLADCRACPSDCPVNRLDDTCDFRLSERSRYEGRATDGSDVGGTPPVWTPLGCGATGYLDSPWLLRVE